LGLVENRFSWNFDFSFSFVDFNFDFGLKIAAFINFELYFVKVMERFYKEKVNQVICFAIAIIIIVITINFDSIDQKDQMNYC